MSGVFTFIDLHHEIDLQSASEQVISSLTHRPWYQHECALLPNLQGALGRIRVGAFNPQPQPVTRADGQAMVAAVGELYNTTELQQALAAQGLPPGPTDLPSLALQAYDAYGLDFPRHLNGVFFVVILDHALGRLVAANDRFGLYPHYFWCQNGQFAIAPQIRGVLAMPFVQRRLDLTAVAEYMRFQHLLGTRTFHEGISKLCYGSILTFSFAEGRCRIRPYWDWDQIPHRPQITLDEAVEETGRLLRQSIARRTSDDLRTGVFLSGGMDGRTIAGIAHKLGRKPITATFGREDCSDVHYGRRIAAALGLRNHWFDMPDGRWVLDNVDFHLALTEGLHSWIHMHGIHMLPSLRQHIDYNLSGWEGSVLGSGYDPLLNREADWPTMRAEIYHALLHRYTWPGMREVDERELYCESLRPQMIGRAYESYLQDIARFEHFRRDNVADYHFYSAQCFRQTIHMNRIARSHIEVRFPFWDYDLMDFVHSLPNAIRYEQYLYRHVLTRELPRMAHIPLDKDDLLPTTEPVRRRVHAVAKRLSKRLRLKRSFYTLYANYEQYLRTDLRAWGESILYDRRMQERGLFDPHTVRTMMERLQSGREYPLIGSVAPLMTFEMMMREYFD